MMKKQQILILVILLSILFSCKKENEMFRHNLENQKIEVTQNLEEAKKEKYINETEYQLLHDRLIGDCNACLNSENRMTCSELEDMTKEALTKFENIKMNEELAGIIALHYFVIATANQVRYLNFMDLGEYCNPASMVHAWYEARQTTADKFNDIRNYVRRMEDTPFEKIPSEKVKEVMQRAYSDIDKVEQDSTLADQAIKEVIKTSLESSKMPEMEMMYTHTVANIYFRLARVRNIDDSDISEYFTSLENNPERKPLSDQALELYVAERIDFLLEEGLIERSEHNLLTKYLREDVRIFFHGNESNETLKERVKYSLSQLKNLHLDTEDREFVAETYYDIASRKGIEIGSLLDNWLYE